MTFNYSAHFHQGNTMKKFTTTTIAGLLALTMSVSAVGFAGGKDTKTTAKDSKAACCAGMDAKACSDKDAASCPDMKSKASAAKDTKSAKATKASIKSKKSAPVTAATGGTN